MTRFCSRGRRLQLCVLVLLLIGSEYPARLAFGQVNVMVNWSAPSSDTDRTISVGDTVTWVWADTSPHTVTSTTPLFESGQLTGIGTQFKFVFNSVGVFPYFCRVHGSSSMSGTITVGPRLPVELTSLNAIVDASDVILTWDTASETNNAGFFVQMEALTDIWNDIAFVEGAGTSRSESNYRHRVQGLSPGAHRFRLKQIDFDGSTEFSEVLEVTIEVPGTHIVGSAFPNPFGPNSQFRSSIDLVVGIAQGVAITVHSADGRLTAQIYQGTLEAGTMHKFSIDGSEWPSGSYILTIRGQNFDDSRLLTLVR